MKLSETVELMNSSDYKERFRAEFFQLDIRIRGLRGMLEKYRNGTLEFVPKCSYALLSRQLRSMTQYIVTLKERAEVEGIDLSIGGDDSEQKQST